MPPTAATKQLPKGDHPHLVCPPAAFDTVVQCLAFKHIPPGAPRSPRWPGCPFLLRPSFSVSTAGTPSFFLHALHVGGPGLSPDLSTLAPSGTSFSLRALNTWLHTSEVCICSPGYTRLLLVSPQASGELKLNSSTLELLIGPQKA